MNQSQIFPFFLGIFAIAWGLSIFLRLFYHIDIPIGRMFVGFLLCYIGYNILRGTWQPRTNHRIRSYQYRYDVTKTCQDSKKEENDNLY